MLHNLPTEVEVNKLLCCGLNFCDTHILGDLLAFEVGILYEQSACHAYILLLLLVGFLHVHLKQTKILLACEHFKSLRLEFGSHHDLKEDRLEKLGSLSVQRTVHSHDAAID